MHSWMFWHNHEVFLLGLAMTMCGSERRAIMRLITFTCPSCGARLDVNVENKTATCQFCGATFPIEDETQHIQIDGAAQAGYEFEKGRQRAQAEAARMQSAPQPAPTQQQPTKKRRTWLWVLGWIFIFPVPLTLIMRKKKNMNPIARYGIIIAGWLLYLAIGLSGGGKKSDNKTKDTSSASVATQETRSSSSEGNKSSSADESKDAKVSEEVASSEAILLEANVPGEYGKEFSVYGGGTENDVDTRLGWFVPEATYAVKNLSKSGPWEQVNYGSPDPTVNDDGFKESSQFKNVLVKPNESADINVPAGGCIYITGDTGKLELTKK